MFDKSDKMNEIFTFLKNIQFKDLSSREFFSDEIRNNPRITMIFTSQRDQVIFFDKGFATIGKTAFELDKKIIQDLENLFKKLK